MSDQCRYEACDLPVHSHGLCEHHMGDELIALRAKVKRLEAQLAGLTELIEKANEQWPCTCMAPGMTCPACEYQKEVVAKLENNDE